VELQVISGDGVGDTFPIDHNGFTYRSADHVDLFRINWNNDSSNFTLADLNSIGGTQYKLETPTAVFNNMVVSAGEQRMTFVIDGDSLRIELP
jgi:hypothetical protein